MTDPDLGYWQYTSYDPNGNLLTMIDAKNQTTTYAYDDLNRLQSKSFSTGDPTVTYVYDTATNGKGLLRSISNSNATTTYNSYDQMGRPTSVTKYITGDANRTTQYAYDLSGKLTSLTYPDSYVVNYNYFAGTGLIDTVWSGSTTFADIDDYEPSGKVGKIRYGNNVITTYGYNNQSTRLTSILTKTAGGTDIQKKSFTYEPSGDIWTITDNVHGTAYTYGYDNLHRLIWENNGSVDTANYSYDAIGNITSKTAAGSTLNYTAYDPAHKHAVKTINVNSSNYNHVYDNNGNMTTGWDFANPSSPVQRTISYNAENMPTSITHSGVTTNFSYDGNATRVKKTEGFVKTYYVGDHYETTFGFGTKYIFVGNLRTAKIEPFGGIKYFHKDHLGSSTAMTSSSGVTLETTEYTPFGSMRSHSGSSWSKYRYTDQELDTEATQGFGLYNYNARLYDPIIGRFISADPIVPDPFNPQSLNRYSYVLNNPLIYIDPSGYQESLFDMENYEPFELEETVIYAKRWTWEDELNRRLIYARQDVLGYAEKYSSQIPGIHRPTLPSSYGPHSGDEVITPIGFSKQEAKKVRKAARNLLEIVKKHKDWPKDKAMRRKLLAALRDAMNAYKVEREYCGKGPAPGYIYLTELAFTKACGPLEATILEEVLHSIGYDHCDIWAVDDELQDYLPNGTGLD